MKELRPLVLALALTSPLLGVTACDDAEQACELDAPQGSANFKGSSASFDPDSSRATLYVDGPEDEPCIEYLSLRLDDGDASMGLSLSPPEGGGALEVGGASYGIAGESYIAWGEDLDNFEVEAELGELDGDCTEASLHVSASQIRMALSESEDWGPYMLRSVSVSFSGNIEIVRGDDGVCD